MEKYADPKQQNEIIARMTRDARPSECSAAHHQRFDECRIITLEISWESVFFHRCFRWILQFCMEYPIFRHAHQGRWSQLFVWTTKWCFLSSRSAAYPLSTGAVIYFCMLPSLQFYIWPPNISDHHHSYADRQWHVTFCKKLLKMAQSK